jgi:DNA-binding MarR family transcriptional regulator
MSNQEMETLSNTLTALAELGGENLRVATVRVFLFIATKPMGTTAKMIAKELKLEQPAVNRALLRLSSRGSKISHSVGDPMGLVELHRDPDETRRHLAKLSLKGKRLYATLTRTNPTN